MGHLVLWCCDFWTNFGPFLFQIDSISCGECSWYGRGHCFSRSEMEPQPPSTDFPGLVERWDRVVNNNMVDSCLGPSGSDKVFAFAFCLILVGTGLSCKQWLQQCWSGNETSQCSGPSEKLLWKLAVGVHTTLALRRLRQKDRGQPGLHSQDLSNGWGCQNQATEIWLSQ